MPKTRFIVITGGVLSGLGKGTATAAIARLLKDHRNIVTVKCDGYLNVDPGTMNPVEHGEVFVLHDGGEVDMDFGHYERFLGVQCKSDWNLTSGKVFNLLISKERKGEFLGKTIQIYPHVPQEIKQWWFHLAEREKADIMTIEIGGTVGDIENSWFIEAARQLKKIVGPENVMYIHLTYVPFLDSVGEPKTKPAQRDIALLHETGIHPDIIIARSKLPLSQKLKEKLALFCDVEPRQIISGRDIDTIYEIPLMFLKEGIYELINEKFQLNDVPSLQQWEALVSKIKSPKHEVVIGICGKYTELRDSYASIIEALSHAGAHCDACVRLKWIEVTDIENGKISISQALQGVYGILVPGGFGSRGTEGKIMMIRHAREHKVPFLGICYGLQLAVVEFARNVCSLAGANSTEIDTRTPYPVIDVLPEQKMIEAKGGTMRLGAYEAKLLPGTLVSALYKNTGAIERHRHRYEVNPVFHALLQQKGLVFSGVSENGRLVEFIELANHPYFVASQAHNELTSRLEQPNPLFYGFVKASLCAKTNEGNAQHNQSNPSPLQSIHSLS